MPRLFPRIFCLAALFALPALAAQPAPAAKPKAAAAPADAAKTFRPPGGTASLVPADGDEFATFVARAESGATNIDFLAMRHAWVNSGTFLRVGSRRDELAALQKQLWEAMGKSNAQAVNDTARKILAINYIDMDAQMAMKQSCKMLGDDKCYEHFRYVEMGLFASITDSGDGKTCDTAWDVVSVDEEYFILRVLGFDLEQQAGPGPGAMCDAMRGKGRDGVATTYYFGVDKVFEGYKRIFGPDKQ